MRMATHNPAWTIAIPVLRRILGSVRSLRMAVTQLCCIVSATTCRSTQSRSFACTSEQCRDWGQADLG
jgi:hypothetical protein